MDAKDLEKKVQEKEEQIEEGKPKSKKSAIIHKHKVPHLRRSYQP